MAHMLLRPLHIVHVDDTESGRENVRLVLATSKYPQFVLHSFAAIEDAEKWMGTGVGQLDCLILDLMLVKTTGVDTFAHAVNIFSAIPIIVLTVTNDIDLAYELIHAGADNYLHKSVQGLLPLFIVAAVARKTRPLLPALTPSGMKNAQTILDSIE